MDFDTQHFNLTGFRVAPVSDEESRCSCATIPQRMISFLVGILSSDHVSWSSTNSVGCMYGTGLKAFGANLLGSL
jgi:hypothetical protein